MRSFIGCSRAHCSSTARLGSVRSSRTVASAAADRPSFPTPASARVSSTSLQPTSSGARPPSTARCSSARWRCSHGRTAGVWRESGASGSAADSCGPTRQSSRSARGTIRRGFPISATRRGSGGAYVIGDLTLRSVTAFVQLGLGDGRVNQVGGYVGGGLTLTAPFPSRAHDMAGLAVAAARNGSHFERAQTAGIPAAGEATVELTYLAQIGSWLSVQPDAEYVIHPGGTRALRNARVLGLRVAISH